MFKFTIIIQAESGEHLPSLLKSVFQDPTSDNIQVIVAAKADRRLELEESVKEYTARLSWCEPAGETPKELYEAAKAQIEGEYISFVTENMYYGKNTFDTVEKKLGEGKLYAISATHENSGNLIQTPYLMLPKTGGYKDMKALSENLHFYFPGYFIHHSVLENVPFDSNIKAEQEKDFLLKAWLDEGGFEYIPEANLYYHDSAEDDPAMNLIQYKKDWYHNDMDAFLQKWIDEANQLKESGEVEDGRYQLIIETVVYLLFARFNCNFNDRYKKGIQGEEIDLFLEKVKTLLLSLSESDILAKKVQYKLPVYLKTYLLQLKREKEGRGFELLEEANRRYLKEAKKQDINVKSSIPEEKLIVSAMNYEDGSLIIDFKTNRADYICGDDTEAVVEYNGQKAEVKEVYCYSLLKSFGRTIYRRKQWQAVVPVGTEEFHIKFALVIHGKKCPRLVGYAGGNSRILNISSHCHWEFSDQFFLHQGPDNKYICVVKNTLFNRLKEEVLLQTRLFLNHREDPDYREVRRLRLNYFFRPKKQKERIWVTFDKLYKAGDNGEYMYHYLKAHEKELGIKPYYIVNETAPDYKRLVGPGENILIAGSKKCRDICMKAEVILATHTTVWNYCGFPKPMQGFIRDLFHGEIVCIQHGLTVQKIAQYQHRLYDNTRFYCLGSRYEADNVLQPIYGYRQEELALTGLARYDGLKNNDQKQILITPTWRRDVVNTGIASEKKTHNEHFKKSTYFKIYNGLINNEKLIESAKKNGYRLIYLLHPAMSSQSVDFDRNDYVDIVEASGDMSYEKILTESSLMVTDYSGVQFDFAYMRKPVVYYHPNALPPFYEDGVFHYDTMGFGEICREEEELVDTLCDYMEHECKSKEFYIERADDFFAFDDYNSCARIHQAVEGYLEKRGIGVYKKKQTRR